MQDTQPLVYLHCEEGHYSAYKLITNDPHLQIRHTHGKNEG